VNTAVQAYFQKLGLAQPVLTVELHNRIHIDEADESACTNKDCVHQAIRLQGLQPQ